MGKRIDFPHNNRMTQLFFEEAYDYILEKDQEKALDKIRMIYSYNKSAETVYLYSVILAANERYPAALDMANTMKSYYFEDESRLMMYTTLLFYNSQFIEAENIILNKSDRSYPENRKLWDEVYESFKIIQKEYIIRIESMIEETKDKLQNLEKYTYSEQKEIMETAKLLKLTDLQQVAPKIFNSPVLDMLTQRSFLEVLIAKEDPTTYKIRDYNEYREIVPKDSYILIEHPYIRAISTEVEARLDKNPALNDMLHREIISVLSLFYPFIEEAIPDIQYFVDYFVEKYDINDTVTKDIEVKTVDQEKVDETLAILNQMLAEFE